jgi:hypothetical protein
VTGFDITLSPSCLFFIWYLKLTIVKNRAEFNNYCPYFHY